MNKWPLNEKKIKSDFVYDMVLVCNAHWQWATFSVYVDNDSNLNEPSPFTVVSYVNMGSDGDLI